MSLVILLLISLNVPLYAQEMGRFPGIDSIIKGFGMSDRRAIEIPSSARTSSNHSVKGHLKEYSIVDFTMGKPVVLYETPKKGRYVIVQDGKIIDPRSFLIGMAAYEKYLPEVKLILKDNKRARSLLATECALSPIWVGTAPIGVIAGFVGFGSGIRHRLEKSMEKWKRIVQNYNAVVQKGDFGPQVPTGKVKKVTRTLTAKDYFVFGPGLVWQVEPWSKTIEAIAVNIQNGIYTDEYKFTFKPEFALSKAVSLRIGGMRNNLFFGCKPIFGISRNLPNLKMQYVGTDEDGNKATIQIDEAENFCVGAFFNWNYTFSIVRNYLQVSPGVNAGFVYNSYWIEEENIRIISGTGVSSTEISLTSPEGGNRPKEINLYYNHHSFGGPEIGFSSQAGPVRLKGEYMMNMGYDSDLNGFGVSHSIGVYLMLVL